MFDHGLAHREEVGRQAPYKTVSEQAMVVEKC